MENVNSCEGTLILREKAEDVFTKHKIVHLYSEIRWPMIQLLLK